MSKRIIKPLELTKRQKWAYHRSTSRLNIAEGAVRSGKTVGFNYKFIKAIAEDRSHLPSDAIDIMVGKTFSSLKRNVVNPVLDLVGSDAQLVGQELRIWDTVVHLIGANDERSEGKIRGSSVRKAYGDEITLWPESFFKMLDSRLSFDESQFFGTTNPGAMNHYLKRDYIDRVKELDLDVFHFNLDHNTTLSKRYVEAIKKNYVGLWYKRFILGLWCAAEGAIYDFFDDAEHTITKHPKADFYMTGVDYATSSPTAFILFGVNLSTRPKVWAEREYYWDPKQKERQKTDAELSADFIDFHKEYLGPHWQTKLYKTYLDPSAESLQLQLARDGVMSITEANNDVCPGIRRVSGMLKTGDYAICTTCPGLIGEKYSYVWDAKAQERGEDAPKKVDDHRSDAERYGIFSEFGEDYVDFDVLARL